MSGNSAQSLSPQPRQMPKIWSERPKRIMRFNENSKNWISLFFSLEKPHKVPEGEDTIKIKLNVYFFWKLTNNLPGLTFLELLATRECDASMGSASVMSTGREELRFFWENLRNNLLPIAFLVISSTAGGRCVDGECVCDEYR